MHLAEYLFRRLYQIDIRAVFGIPGDFNLNALDYIEECGLNWIGNVNELNSGYAADGYARIKGISAIITTFGVGELSAINAIAGASAEFVPIIHIEKLPIHHSFADGDFELFMKMSERISRATIILDDPLEATKMIENTIFQCYRSSKPVYIGFPLNMVQVNIDPSPLEHPLLLRLAASEFTNAEEEAVKTIQDRLSQARNPILIVDSLASRHQNLEASRAFVENSSVPCFCRPMAKGIINESLSKFRGIYGGSVCSKGVLEQVKSSDLIILLGYRLTDLNNGGFQDHLPDAEKIVFQQNSVQIGDTIHNNLPLELVLRKLSDMICESPSISSPSSPPSSVASGGQESPILPLKGSIQTFEDKKTDPTSVVTHDWLWKRIGSWLEEDDILAMDAGTSSFGALWFRYAMGATVGAAIAAREQEQASEKPLRRRTILFTGDGSLQMTAQEISTLVRQELGPIIFVICNDGYTIKRYIHGWDKSYNDIQPWNYQLLPTAFNPKPDTVRTYSVRTKGELEILLADHYFGPAENFGKDNPEPLRLVEIHMDKHDAPQTIPDTIAGMRGKN
ncbi:hypothetical protein N7488_006032 [Penicillium malachiteum]|nr:hypothetical protein N7488_006032 [Penicillium malachiteum]